jgi:DNA-binding response OmpR family regulator
MNHVFVVGHENDVSRFARHSLERAGYAVSAIVSVAEAMRWAKEERPSLIVVDVASARRHALELCRRIRRLPSLTGTQLVFIADKASEEDRVAGFESGVDDYITGPFSGPEFVARVGAVLRRLDRSLTPQASSLFPSVSQGLDGIHKRSGSALKVGDIEIDASAFKLSINGREIATTSLEFRLIRYLAENQARVFTRDQLLDAVWGHNQFVSPRTVDAVVRRIRSKIEPTSSQPIYLKTVRGVGYRLDRAIVKETAFSTATEPEVLAS